MMSTATPLRNPVITASETKRRMKPRRASPASSWKIPASATSVASATTRCSGENAASSSPAMIDSAPVVDTFMNTELVNTAATGTAIISV